MENKFCELYANYVLPEQPLTQEKEEQLIHRLIVLLHKLTAYVIFRRISDCSVYRSGDEMTVVQEGHLNAFLALSSDREKGKLRNNPLVYYRRIYKSKTGDYFRSYGLYKAKDQDLQDAPLKGTDKKDRTFTVKKRDIACALNIEALTTDENDESSIDSFRPFGCQPSDQQTSETARHARKLLTIYIQHLLDYKRSPAGPLALMYCRILYQLERIFDPQMIDSEIQSYMVHQGWSTDPADKAYAIHLAYASDAVQDTRPATDPNWAIARMGTQSIRMLLDDSELSLHRNNYPDLFWGAGIRARIDIPSAGQCPLGDLVYTQTYRKSQIEHWASDIHNSMVIRTAKTVRTEPDVLAYIMSGQRSTNKLKDEIHSQILKDQLKQEKHQQKRRLETDDAYSR